MPTVQSFHELLTVIKAEVDRELCAIWAGALREHAARGAAVLQPLDAARELCVGGKRLRAALVAVGHRLGGGDGSPHSVLAACCAVELLQSYFLIHDDWMDGDRVRRGSPAVHAALETHFGSVHLAAAGAVLAGDYTLALATRTLARAEVPDGHWPLVLGRFAQMQLDAVIGQQLDVLGDGSNVEEVYRLKTASYTVLGPLHLGLGLCPTGGADASKLAALEAFAGPVGVAFQLRDDLIGAFADPVLTGKPRGGDLRAGKRTLLVSLALARRGSEVERLLSSVLGDARASNADVERTLAALDASGARAQVEQRIIALARDASDALDAASWEPSARALLDGLMHAMLDRVA